jgi:hypothetical protein
MTITRRLPGASFTIALAVLACGCGSSEKTSQNQATNQTIQTLNPMPSPAATARCEGRSMMGEVLKFKETTNNTLSNKHVGVSNIFERDLPDDKGVIGSRMSAVLVIHDPSTDAIERKTVFAGNIVTFGDDRYCIITVEFGKGSPGWISLRQVK